MGCRVRPEAVRDGVRRIMSVPQARWRCLHLA